jgi:hypothetical protein
MKRLAILTLSGIFFSCAPFAPSSKESVGYNPIAKKGEEIQILYSQTLNLRCHFFTIGDWLRFGMKYAPLYLQQEYARLYWSLPKECLNTPIHTVDLGRVRGNLSDKEESCLGFTNFYSSKEELFPNLLTFLKEQIRKKCGFST